MRTLRSAGRDALGIDVLASRLTDAVGSIVDRPFVRECLHGVDAVLHAATLHKPHVATHMRGRRSSTPTSPARSTCSRRRSRRGSALRVHEHDRAPSATRSTPPPGSPAAWITEEVAPVPKNIYGVTKVAAESLCELVHRARGCRASSCGRRASSRRRTTGRRSARLRRRQPQGERVPVPAGRHRGRRSSAHRAGPRAGPAIGFGRYIISATTPFRPTDLEELAADAPRVVGRRVPATRRSYARLGWRMFCRRSTASTSTRGRGRIWAGGRATTSDGAGAAAAGEDWRSPLARVIGAKGYHDRAFAEGPYPVD